MALTGAEVVPNRITSASPGLTEVSSSDYDCTQSADMFALQRFMIKEGSPELSSTGGRTMILIRSTRSRDMLAFQRFMIIESGPRGMRAFKHTHPPKVVLSLGSTVCRLKTRHGVISARPGEGTPVHNPVPA